MKTEHLPVEYLDKIIEIALAEDIGQGDVTSDSIIPCDLQGQAYLLVKATGVVAGLEVVGRVFHKVDPALKVETLIQDGTAVKNGDILMLVSGNVRSILKSERVALNFIQRLSGVASQPGM